jgi:hypothetical protein
MQVAALADRDSHFRLLQIACRVIGREHDVTSCGVIPLPHRRARSRSGTSRTPTASSSRLVTLVQTSAKPCLSKACDNLTPNAADWDKAPYESLFQTRTAADIPCHGRANLHYGGPWLQRSQYFMMLVQTLYSSMAESLRVPAKLLYAAPHKAFGSFRVVYSIANGQGGMQQTLIDRICRSL